MVGIIERIEMVMQKYGGKLPRCELVDALANNFGYYDEEDPTIIGMIRNACRDLGISLEYEENLLTLVNALKGDKVDWEEAWLFIKPEMVNTVTNAIELIPLTGCTVMEWDTKITVNGKEYKVVHVYSKLDVILGDYDLLDKVIKVKYPRVLADDNIITGFIVEGVEIPYFDHLMEIKETNRGSSRKTNLKALLECVNELREKFERDKIQYGDEYLKFLTIAGGILERYDRKLAIEFYEECSWVCEELAKIYICSIHDTEMGLKYAEKSVKFCELVLTLMDERRQYRDKHKEKPKYDYPSYYIALQNLGMAYYESGLTKRAIGVFKKIERELKDADYPLREIYPVVLANLSLCYADVGKKENAVEYVLKFAYTTWKEYGEIDVETVERVVNIIGKDNDAYLLLLLIDFAKFRKGIPEVLEELENIRTERAKKVARAIEEHKIFVPMDGVEELFLELLMTGLRKCI
jgi:tetratricopeptide (TPR) repeat protein